MGQEPLLVQLKSEDHENTFNWRCELDVHAPLKDVIRRWAERYSIKDPSVAGLEADADVPLDVEKTPKDLGWCDFPPARKAALIVWVVPLNDKYGGPNPSLLKKESPGQIKRKSSDAVQVQSEAKRQKEDVKLFKDAEKRQMKEVEKQFKEEEKRRKEEEKKKKDEEKKKQKEYEAMAKKATGVPTGDDEIEFVPNPKRPGSLAYDRYESYCTARTVNEALMLGAAQGDIKNDYKSGHCRLKS